MSEKEYVEAVTEYADMVYRIAFHHCVNREIAAILQCKETTVQTRLMRARKMLRQRLQGGFGDDE